MINLNGKVIDAQSFDWLSDSGFRYGYGCFETMRCVNGKVSLLDYHYNRLISSLQALTISYSTPKETLSSRIQALYDALDNAPTTMVCRIYVSGGDLSPIPGFESVPNEIISLQPLSDAPMATGYEFKRVTPTEFFKLKSMNYAHHIIELQSSKAWPIYVDHENIVIDSSIFAVGIVLGERVIFAKHEYQLPSVSRQVFLERCSDGLIAHEPLTRMDLASSDAVIGCNAVSGIFLIDGNDANGIVNQLTNDWMII